MCENYDSPEIQELDDVNVPESADFCEEMKLLVHLAKEYPDDVELELYQPASEDSIREFEEKNDIRLPDSLRQFYKFADGMSLAPSNLNIFPLADVEAELDTEFEWGDEKNYILIGDMIGDGKIILLDLDTGKLVTNDHGEEEDFEDVSMLLFDTIAIFFDGEFEDDQLDEYLAEPED